MELSHRSAPLVGEVESAGNPRILISDIASLQDKFEASMSYPRASKTILYYNRLKVRI